MAWPAVHTPPASTLLALQYQFERSERWPAEILRHRQFGQLRELLAHAARSVPFYMRRLPPQLPAEIDGAFWHGLPTLTRAEIQQAGEALWSQSPPAAHGQILDGRTSGSAGRPVHFRVSEINALFWQAFTLRDHLWHGRDLSARLATVKVKAPGGEQDGWGASTDGVFATGPSVSLDVKTDVVRQAAWLREQRPRYLISYPSNLRALARHFIDQGWILPGLAEVRSFAEALPEDLRALCRQAWDAPLTDTYSSEECGYIALQCPKHEHYHVMAESLLVEVLHPDGRPCAPGETGRVVITTLLNFAMPLIRYEIGDWAEVGAPCSCGRGLPVLKRIMGRRRNMVTLPDGSRHWPSFPGTRWLAVAPVTQFQLVQTTRHHIQVLFAAKRSLSEAEIAGLRAMLHDTLGYPFAIDFEQVAEVEPGPGHKYEDFVSLVED